MELTLDQALQKGVEAHKAGEAQTADVYYTAILKSQPKHPDANHNMGVLTVGLGKVEAALPFLKTALEANPRIAQYWLSYLDALIKLDRMADAKAVFDQARQNGAEGDAFDQIEEKLVGSKVAFEKAVSSSKIFQDPTPTQLQALIKLVGQGQQQQPLKQCEALIQQYPQSAILFNIKGVVLRRLGDLNLSVEAYTKAISLKPNYYAAYNNLGNSLQDQGKLDEAIEAFTKALSIKPDYAEAYNNVGNALKEQGKLNEAIEAYSQSLAIKPDYAEANSNMGSALKEQGKLDKAIEAYNKALFIKPDYADVYYNVGNAFKEKGKLDKAIEAYNEALSVKPDYADAHRNLTSIKKYTKDDKHFIQVQQYYDTEVLSEDTKCQLSFALAKIYEDIGELNKSFNYLSEGNALRKKILNYSIEQDEKLFSYLKKSQVELSNNKLELKQVSSELSPIFILGLPRSGTTLVEQIISSHSKVFGAGELKYVEHFGKKLAIDPRCINAAAISAFREKYLSELSIVSNGKYFVSDKMPQNFRFIPLICAALPEAKIIHVQRNATATCWSNYKQYFVSGSLGYCYDLTDVATYYFLYRDLMQFWQSQYGDKIYNLNYESLTNDQENQTRKLVKHLELKWEDTCLSPQKNKRSVRTASQQQVRQKVYKGSSEAWRKYEPYLNGAFDSLPSS